MDWLWQECRAAFLRENISPIFSNGIDRFFALVRFQKQGLKDR